MDTFKKNRLFIGDGAWRRAGQEDSGALGLGGWLFMARVMVHSLRITAPMTLQNVGLGHSCSHPAVTYEFDEFIIQAVEPYASFDPEVIRQAA